MYQKVVPLVLWAAYDPIRFTDWTQVKVVESMFASYLEEETVNATRASRIMNGEIPRTIMHHYADAEYTCCPEALYLDVSTFVFFAYGYSSVRRRVYEELLAVLEMLPEEDREALMPQFTVIYPSQEQIASLLSDLLWYAMAQDLAMPNLETA